MIKREPGSPARLRSAFEQLSSSARSLNTSTDELSEIFAAFDDSLKKLNLGIIAWVTFCNSSDEPGWFSYLDQLGYTKIGGKWGLAIRQLKCDEQHDETEVLQEWLLAEAPRALRIKAVDGLPELAENLAKEVKSATKRIDEKLALARELLTVVKDLGTDEDSAGVKE